MSDQSELPDQFVKLRQKFIARCRGELLALVEIEGNAAFDPESRRLLSQKAHSLAGAGGTFGFAEISEVAHRLEVIFAADEAPDDASVKTALRSLIEALESMPSA